jgi:RimJ/RimL family protein N-acetyltransferase
MTDAPASFRLEGRVVRVEPLSARLHARDLWEAIGQPKRHDLWRFIPTGPFPAPEAFAAFIDTKGSAADAKWFAIVSQASGKAVGVLALMREDKVHRVIEVGGIILAPELQRTIGATEAQYLLARHVFETLNYRRYEWKCDNGNAASKRAAERLGFTFEGVFRQHMLVKGKNRDTAWFSMLDSEWPLRKAAFEAWLDPKNFDDTGRQRNSLEASNTPAARA